MTSGSKPSSLKDLIGPRVQIRAIVRNQCGSPATVHLSAERFQSDGPGTALILAEHGLSLRVARDVVTRLFDEGAAVTILPVVESLEILAKALAPCGVTVSAYGTPEQVDVKAIRSGFGLSQEEFALSFGLEAASVRNWEQGRSEPDTATRSFLTMIRTHPDAVRDALKR